jgi:hypothetical protein
MEQPSKNKIRTASRANLPKNSTPANFVKAVAQWRGYKNGVLDDLACQGLFTSYHGKPAFRVFDLTGRCVGWHVRDKIIGVERDAPKGKREWIYAPKDIPATPFIVGNLTSDTKTVHVHESEWDLCARIDVCGLQKDTVDIATRGATNVQSLRALALPASATVYAWPQTDGPAKRWLAALPRVLGRGIKVCRIEGASDLNNLCRQPLKLQSVLEDMMRTARVLLPSREARKSSYEIAYGRNGGDENGNEMS